jgi:hypothetical protein
MTTIKSRTELVAWSTLEKVVFRFFFLFFAIQIVPLDWKLYRDLFTTDWSGFNYGILFTIAHYAPRVFSDSPVFADWALFGGIAAIGTIVWSYADSSRKEYNVLYYYLRVVLRYRLAIALIAYGFIKFYPLQAPYPSISNLNTNYGDYNAWKIFAMSLGIVPGFQAFLGGVEIAAALLLLYRKTTAVGAFIILAFTGNVVLSNLAYEGGEYVYSFYLVLIAGFLLAYDVPRLVNLLTLERPTAPSTFKIIFNGDLNTYRIILKTTYIFVFVFLYAFLVYRDYRNGIDKYPQTQGLKDAAGLYDVAEYRINNQVLPYSKTDSVRWRDVVFEEWNTLSVRSLRKIVLNKTNAEYVAVSDAQRKYELEGSGGRLYFAYEIDSASQTLSLSNRNEEESREPFTLHYQRPDSATIILSGLNETRDSVHVVLRKVDKKYLLKEAATSGRRGGLKL